jgi:hypothetical protein
MHAGPRAATPPIHRGGQPQLSPRIHARVSAPGSAGRGRCGAVPATAATPQLLPADAHRLARSAVPSGHAASCPFVSSPDAAPRLSAWAVVGAGSRGGSPPAPAAWLAASRHGARCHTSAAGAAAGPACSAGTQRAATTSHDAAAPKRGEHGPAAVGSRPGHGADDSCCRHAPLWRRVGAPSRRVPDPGGRAAGHGGSPSGAEPGVTIAAAAAAAAAARQFRRRQGLGAARPRHRRACAAGRRPARPGWDSCVRSYQG